MTVNAQRTATSRPRIERVNRGKSGHSYKIDGRSAPGVTSIINKALPKSALMYWSARTVAEYVTDLDPAALDALRALGRDQMIEVLKKTPWSRRDAAALVGTEVHKLAERLLRGEEIDVSPEFAGHIESAVKFLDTWKVVPVIAEAVVASRRWGYCGTLDAVVDLPDGRRAVIDYKTSKAIYPETGIQLAAYRYAEVFIDQLGDECQMSTLDVDCGYGVNLRSDGFDVHPLECGPRAYSAFLHLVNLSKIIDDMGEWVGEPETPETWAEHR
jgi:hypothetical protein